MSHLVLRRSRQLAATTVVGAVAGVALVAVATPQAQAADTVVASPTLQWQVSQYFAEHLSTRTFSGGATEGAGGQVSFPNGEGTYDSRTGAAHVEYDGVVRGAFAFAGTTHYWVEVGEPAVSVDADGNGELSAVVSGWQAAGRGAAEQQTTPARVTVATFDAADGWAPDGGLGTLTATPDWEGVLATGSSEAAALGLPAGQPVEGRSFHPEFLSQVTQGARPLFYASGSANGDPKKPVSAFTAQAQAAPSVSVEQTSATPEGGVTLAVSGTGFRGETNPGDAGVYVGLAPAGGLPDVSDREAMDLFANVQWVNKGSIVDGAFSTQLVATIDKFDTTQAYSVYTWQAHTHSNTSQDTETPVEIPFEAITPVGAPELTYVGTHTSRHASTGWIGVDVTNVEDEAAWVEMTGFGARKTLNVRGGQALFKIPANAPKGTYQATFTLHTYEEGAVGDGTSLTKTFVVKAGQTAGTVAVTKAPTPRAKGTVDLAVRHLGNATLHAPRPSGRFTVKVYAESGPLRWQSAQLWMSNGARNGVELPALSSGRYLVHLTYHGSGTSLATTSSQWVTVR
ncbi:HtaA domain-containing protein [Nocardioides zeae]|uniref:HtaA domain-containing protein n=1 Tax=Nocardioides imazamoxiresistens TaxID=3231893 RepID=A0ABU3PU21_9ACTN|nr:HtaA domain-containing protein [Nocardioides zeae]MDT9592734.1 HtaA domain-containing protein [Nocardioides zeae]